MVRHRSWMTRTELKLTALFFALLIKTLCIVAINPEGDFEGYMEILQQRKAAHSQQQDMLEKHEIWRQTTWQGWCVRQLQALGDHFLPFIETVDDAVRGRDDKNTARQIATTIVLRAMMVAAYVAALYAIARLFNIVLDREFVIEEEVIIEHENASDIPSETKSTQRRGRGKKDKKKES